ncbi:xanthine dehydrogenase accessory protein XdhC [Candidatus Methylacidiphilum infernorum]|uniref:Xanthine and CO dehydrogenase maturation factor, XdhC/CoxF family n=1 Tax=Methylacidiphilum infernorum (isolate V4) TaxID=481448 RepID=B3E0E3_METI4|nr:xanthine dehydrogenase accessory protein XdhC [Candidatus Methylacidiphilum infernorum]ACD84372.1 Xanthine and CO dehydrogenase maturation factor, XdhC/CoxF family [Methylacidiphilum infernorum V4]
MNTSWIDKLRELFGIHRKVVIVTITNVRGHAPQEVGAKMLVTKDESFGTIGGGNLEKSAIVEAQKMLDNGEKIPRSITLRLGAEKGEWGAQCCGGEVSLFLEPLSLEVPQVAIFGIGHVGKALAKVLSLLPLELFLVDSRPEMLHPSRLPPLDCPAIIHCCPGLVPEKWISVLSPGACVVILTHDHAEDLVILEAALARPDLRYVGVIGSETKRAHFRKRLKEAGYGDEVWSRVTMPIGIPGIGDKTPAAIAISTAAQLLSLLFAPSSKNEEALPPCLFPSPPKEKIPHEEIHGPSIS